MSNSDEKCWLEVYVRDRYDDAWRIQWVFEGFGEGGTLGEDVHVDADLADCEPEERSHVIAVVTASKTEGVERDQHGFYWPSKAKANAALRAIKAAWKTNTGASWPEWAVKAQAAGWKPPKGWKP